MPVWNESNARHLLSRCLFGYRREELTSALSKPLAEFVDKVLLAPGNVPFSPGTWIDETPIPNNNAVDRQRQGELRNWWLELMLTQASSIREKMVLFWHNHFVSEISKVNYPQRMYHQNQLFRKHALGNFKTLTKAVTTDPAMLVYLDGNGSSKGNPNENYGRELLELFTIGIGNYSENDVKEASRALTGWRVTGLKADFNSSRFDNTNKTFLGQTGNFNHDTLIDVIFTKPQTAQFICRKLYKEFVCPTPDENFINQMADVFRQHNYEIKPLLHFLFTSDHFYAPQWIGVKIKSPLDLIIGALKQLNIENPEWNYLFETGRTLQQEIFEPPDVRGWEGQRKWVSSVTYPVRNTYTDSIISGKKINGQNLKFKVDALSYARSYANSEDASKLVDEIIAYLLQFPLSSQRRNFLLDTLLDGTIAANWSTYTPMAEARIRNFLRTLMRLPEYQLC